MTGLVERIDAILPQTQCTQCSYEGCRPYAEALARGEADINQCPPGGDSGIRALAQLMAKPYVPLNPVHGVIQPKMLAIIDETVCIGCTLCIKACPVDAILGAHKQMHTVLAEECTGCELCVAPCPVDCISMQPLEKQDWDYTQPISHARQVADLARARYQARLQRLERTQVSNTPVPESRVAGKTDPQGLDAVAARKAALVAAMARARSQRADTSGNT